MLLGALVVLTRSDRAAPTGPAPSVPAPPVPAPTVPATTVPARTVVGRTDARSRVVAGHDHIEAPVITGVTVAGLDAALAWRWIHARAWDEVALRLYLGRRDPDTGRFAGEELVGEERLQNAAAVADGELRGTLSHRVPEAGLYSFRLEVIARNRPVINAARGSGHDATWHAWQREKVLVGAEGWSIVPLPGLRGDLLHDARDPRFAFFFELYRGPSLVRDCDLDYRLEWPAPTHGHDCDWETGERSIILDNPDAGTPGSWRLALAWADHRAPFDHVRLESAFRDDGVPGGTVAGKSGPADSR